MVFGNLNYQIGNGGLSQWHGNRYYSDTIDYLREFIAKYGDHYPSFKKVGDLLDRFEALPEEFGGGDQDLDEILSGKFVDKIGEIIGNDDWEELEDHVGGTEYDRRYVDRATRDTLEGMLSVEVEEAAEDEDGPRLTREPGGPPPGPTGKFTWVIKDNEDNVLRHAETTYDDEDSAYEAAEDASNELVDEAKNEENELWDKASEEVKNDIEKELRHSVERDVERKLGQLDDDYDAISDEVVEEVSSLLRTEFNVGHDIMGFITKAMSKARMAVASALEKPIRSFKSGTANILSRAATKIRPKDAPRPPAHESTDSVQRLLC